MIKNEFPLRSIANIWMYKYAFEFAAEQSAADTRRMING